MTKEVFEKFSYELKTFQELKSLRKIAQDRPAWRKLTLEIMETARRGFFFEKRPTRRKINTPKIFKDSYINEEYTKVMKEHTTEYNLV